eukprot:1692242-Lingulodinium_polyedra.AAC.1
MPGGVQAALEYLDRRKGEAQEGPARSVCPSTPQGRAVDPRGQGSVGPSVGQLPRCAGKVHHLLRFHGPLPRFTERRPDRDPRVPRHALPGGGPGQSGRALLGGLDGDTSGLRPLRRQAPPQ